MSPVAGLFQNLRRRSGAVGAPPLKAGQLFQNEVEDVIYAGYGDDGAGNATQPTAIGGKGAFIDKVTAQTIGGVKTFALSPKLPTPTLTELDATKAAPLAFVRAMASHYLRPVNFVGSDGTLADPTGVAESTKAFLAMLATATPGSVIEIGADVYLSDNLTVPDGVWLRGAHGYPDAKITAGVGAANPYGFGAQIRLKPSATITLGNGCRLSNLVILPTGLSLPARTNAQATTLLSQFAGTAITSDTASIEIDHCTILGFATGILAKNSGGAGISNKVRVYDNVIDCLTGVDIDSSGDTCHVGRNHIFPVLTISIPGVSAANITRSGYGILLNNQDTSSSVFDNLVFGFAIGGQGTNVSQVTWLRNRFEAPPGAAVSIGLSVNGQYIDIAHVCAIGYPYGIATDTSAAAAGNDLAQVSFCTCIMPAGSTFAIGFGGGFAIAIGNLIQNASIAFNIGSAATGWRFIANRLPGATTPISNGATAATNIVQAHNDGLPDRTLALVVAASDAAAAGAGVPVGGTYKLSAQGPTTQRAASAAFTDAPAYSALPGRNALINGNFGINQRAYASNTALAAGAYAHDRWKAGSSGCTYTFTQASPDTTITITAGTLVQAVDVGNMTGGAYWLSWAGTATARVWQGSAAGAYAASPILVTGLAAGTVTTVEFSTGTLGKAQLEPQNGSAGPTVFERRHGEMSLCQRYYQTFTGVLVSGYGGVTGAAIYEDFSLPVSMRAVPTAAIAGATYSNASGAAVANSYAGHVVISATATAAGAATATLNLTLAAEL